MNTTLALPQSSSTTPSKTKARPPSTITPSPHAASYCTPCTAPLPAENPANPATEVGGWMLSRHTLTPTPAHLLVQSAHLADYGTDDLLVEFRFPASTPHQSLFVHRSRLDLVSGAFPGLVPDDYEKSRSVVSLGKEDDPADFAIVRQFLYCLPLDLSKLEVGPLLSLAFTSERLDLDDLFGAVLLYIENYAMLDSARTILDAAPLLTLQLTTKRFKKQYCSQLCAEIDGIIHILSTDEDAQHKTGDIWLQSSPSNAGHPESLWEKLYAQNLLSFVLHQLPVSGKRKHQTYLVHALMRHLEPVIASDDVVISLLLQLGWNEHDAGAGVFSNAAWIRTWSSRALQLSALAMRAPVDRGISVTIPCRVRVADMRRCGRMFVRSRRYSVGSTVCYLTCGREVLPQGGGWSGRSARGKRLYHGMSLYVHLERGSAAAESVDDEGDLRIATTPVDVGIRFAGNSDGGLVGHANSDESDESDVLRGCSKVKVWARVMNDGCRCALVQGDEEAWHGVVKEAKMVFDVNGVVVRGVQHGWDCLLDEPTVENWTARHQDRCAITVTAVVELVRAAGDNGTW